MVFMIGVRRENARRVMHVHGNQQNCDAECIAILRGVLGLHSRKTQQRDDVRSVVTDHENHRCHFGECRRNKRLGQRWCLARFRSTRNISVMAQVE